tara:strand:+ start:248 stop:793 length:546 start_codon:yes stop_codon:yes gene_type:complete
MMNRRQKHQRIRHLVDFERLNEKFLEIKKEFDALEEDVARRHEAHRQEFSKEMRKATDEYQKALAQYEEYVTGPIERINAYKLGKRLAIKRKIEPYYKQLELHPGRPQTIDEQFVDQNEEIIRLRHELEQKGKPEWLKALEQYEYEQMQENEKQRNVAINSLLEQFHLKMKLEKAAQSTTA